MSTSFDIPGETALRHQVVLGGVNYGYFKGEEVDSGSEVKEDWDPELGSVLIRGRKTGDDLKLERLWLPSRDERIYRFLRPKRGQLFGFVNLFTLDEFDQPTSSTPLDVLQVLLTNVPIPPSSDSSDGRKLKLTVKVRA